MCQRLKGKSGKKIPKNEMKRHFEIRLMIGCINCVVKTRVQITIIGMFLFLNFFENITNMREENKNNPATRSKLKILQLHQHR